MINKEDERCNLNETICYSYDNQTLPEGISTRIDDYWGTDVIQNN